MQTNVNGSKSTRTKSKSDEKMAKSNYMANPEILEDSFCSDAAMMRSKQQPEHRHSRAQNQ